MSVESFAHAGLSVRIEYDRTPQSSRDWHNLGAMVCFHRRYTLGDDHNFDTPAEFESWWKQHGQGGVRLPLYLYDHSGITMNTVGFHCPWDSGQVGYVYVTRARILAELGGKIVTKSKRESAKRQLVQEVETYDQFLTGQVYGYVIENDDDDELDSCWGNYGLENCIAEAKSAAEHQAKRIELARQWRHLDESAACRDV